MKIDRDTEFIILAGIRYSIGRRSYAPSLACDWIKRHWAEFPHGLKYLIRRDVVEEVDRLSRFPGALDGDCDQADWIMIADWLNSRPESEFRGE